MSCRARENARQADCGSTLVPVYGVFGTTLALYGFDVSIQFSYQLGGRLYDGTYQSLMHTGTSSTAGTNWHTDILDAWSQENPGSDIPRLNAGDDSYQRGRWLGGASGQGYRVGIERGAATEDGGNNI